LLKLKMLPKKQFLKYKCCESSCGSVVRSDKWINHCKHVQITKQTMRMRYLFYGPCCLN
jgi:hypothetical protein